MSTIKISDIKINSGRIPIDPATVSEIARSIEEIGLINPITITKDNVLIAGLHRIEAMRSLGKDEIPCVKLDIDELKTQLAEIDENIVRQELHFLDRGEQLIKRKEIYEEIYQDGKANVFKGNQYMYVLDAPISFTKDVSKKLQMSQRTIQQEIQIARDLTEEAKKLIREKEIGKKQALSFAAIDKEQQQDILQNIMDKKVKTLGGALRKLTPKEQGKVVNVKIKTELYNIVKEFMAKVDKFRKKN